MLRIKLWVCSVLRVSVCVVMCWPKVTRPKEMAMALGHPFAMALVDAPWPWSMAPGHGPWQCPLAMANGHGPWPRLLAMALSHGPWPWPLANGHGRW